MAKRPTIWYGGGGSLVFLRQVFLKQEFLFKAIQAIFLEKKGRYLTRQKKSLLP